MASQFTKAENKAWLEYEKGFERDFSVDDEPEVQNSWFSHGEYILVGHGKQTNEKCGTFLSYYGCLREDLHNLVTLDGYDYHGKGFAKKVFRSCDRPECPICFKRGWAVTAAGRIERRIREAEKRFGKALHIVVSVPDADFGLTYESLQKKVVKVMSDRGIIGGCKIFHAFRYANSAESRRRNVPCGWFFSPHFHVLGFIGGSGYGHCRNIADFPVKCKACSGFEGVTRRCYDKEGGRSGSGYIVKVLAERKTIGGTAWYQLNHASVRRGSKNSHVASWFGCCSYHKLKIINGDLDVGVKFSKCPICGEDLVRLRFLGDFSKLNVSRAGDIVDLYDEVGNPLWEVRSSKGG